MRNVKEVIEPVALRKTEYYAIKEDTLDTYEVVVVGPAPTIDGVLALIDDDLCEGQYIIATKVKKVVVT